DSRLVYTCDRPYSIDVPKRCAAPLRWWSLGHGFECSVAATDHVHVIRSAGVEIGRYRCDPFAAVTAPGRLAIPCFSEADHRYCIRIWSPESQRWDELAVNTTRLVGWVRARV
ncbi:MAG: hypothetical protein KDC98_09705, partial [Planctomycetes bacterium]|nr:hypothetical protein [Planctomycetota bacterium]